MTADQLMLEELNEIGLFSESHDVEWRNEVAADLNQLLGRAAFELETCGDESDCAFARSVILIVERVAESEHIERKPRE